MQEVIEGSWEADPHKRLTAAQVVHKLTDAHAAVEQMDADCPRAVVTPLSMNAAAGGSCCVVS